MLSGIYIITVIYFYKLLAFSQVLQALICLKGSRKLWLPEFMDSWHINMVRLSALHTRVCRAAVGQSTFTDS
jgi:hypothetical protein